MQGQVDGAINPELIPDHVAYEVFLRSLTADEKDAIGQRRARAFAEDAGLRGTEADDLLTAAAEFEQSITSLDSQVKIIKDKNWPSPSDAVLTQLTELQQQKVALITDKAATLSTRLSQDAAGRIVTYVNNTVKHQIKGSIAPSPTATSAMHHPKLGLTLATVFLLIPPSTTANMATQYMINQYTSCSATFSPYYEEVYGYGQLTEAYNSYGHTHQVTAKVTSPDGRIATNVAGYSSAPVSTTAYTSIVFDGVGIDGNYFARTDSRGYCPQSHAYFTEPSATSDVLVPNVIVSQNLMHRQYEDPNTGFWHYTQHQPCSVRCPVFGVDDPFDRGEKILAERQFDVKARQCRLPVTIVFPTSNTGCSERRGP
jgi:hypothetical protein